jgi:hypothetical protein
MHFPLMNRSALLRRPPVLQAAAAVLLTSAFMLPAARAQAAETADKASTGQASASPAPLTKGEIKAQREFKMLDFNKDGKLSRTEVALFPRLAAAFDKDGYVSYAEVQAFAVKYRAERDKAKAKAQAEEAKAAEHAAAVSAARDTKEGEGSKD